METHEGMLLLITYIGSLMAPLNLTLSELEMSNSRSLILERATCIFRKGAELGQKLLLLGIYLFSYLFIYLFIYLVFLIYVVLIYFSLIYLFIYLVLFIYLLYLDSYSTKCRCLHCYIRRKMFHCDIIISLHGRCFKDISETNEGSKKQKI